MTALHTPGRACDACEGFCVESVRDAGVEISLRIGQRVRHRDYKGQRVTGVVHCLSIESNRVLEADIVLDAPIVIPARGTDDREISIWRQHLPAHELTPFDERDELITEMLAALQLAAKELQAMRAAVGAGLLTDESIASVKAAIAKATGSAA